ncbi:MAG: cobalamin B12-binding domain-containing protein [Gammaproteobacteria bacterium]
MNRPLRILVAKPGLDGHDRGALVLAQALRDDGMEVIYTGLRVSPRRIAAAAVQEDVDLVCVSILSGAHNIVFADLFEELRAAGGDDIPVLAGGVIPQGDFAGLRELGVREIFTPGSALADICACIHREVGR